MWEQVVNVITSQPVGIFTLLFLNNVLMYLVLTKSNKKNLEAMRRAHTAERVRATETIGSLRGIVHAFSDDKNGIPMILEVSDDFVCSHSHQQGGGCYLVGEHVH